MVTLRLVVAASGEIIAWERQIPITRACMGHGTCPTPTEETRPAQRRRRCARRCTRARSSRNPLPPLPGRNPRVVARAL